MIYKPNDTFLNRGKLLKCVLDNDSSCEHCVFNDEGGSCPAREYDRHPCYHTDRGDEHDVHFVEAN